jgi:hypothetical protein
MAGGGDLGFYIGAYDGTGGGGTPDGDATLFLTSRGYTQARGYEYWDSLNSLYKKWNGAAWLTVGGSGGSSPWSESGSPATIYPTTFSTDDVVVGANAMAGTERFRVAGDARIDSGTLGMRKAPLTTTVIAGQDDLSTTAGTIGVDMVLPFSSGDPKTSWWGYSTFVNHTGSGTIGGVQNFRAEMSVGASGTITNGYGFYSVGKAGAGTLTNAYGLYLAAQGGATLSYGVYQAGTGDKNAFLGKVFVGATDASGLEDFRVNGDTFTDGQIGIHTAPLTTKLIAGSDDLSDTAGTTGVDMVLDYSATSGTKTSWWGYSTFIDHTGNGGTVGSVQSFRAEMSIAAGGTVNTGYGFYSAGKTGSGTLTTAYGLYLAAQSGGTSSYGVYQADAGDTNVFVGDTVVGTTSMDGTEHLRVYAGDASGAVVTLRTELDTGGSISSWKGIEMEASVNTGHTVSGSAYAIFIDDWLGDGTISGNAYGVFISDVGSEPTVSGQTYAFYQSSSSNLNYFAGNVGVGIPPTSSSVVYARERSTSASMFHSVFDTSAASIGAVRGFESDLDVNSGHTVVLYHGVSISDVTGAGSIDNAVGVFVGDLGNGPTINTESYGVYIDDQTQNSSSTPYAMYQAGADDHNYFAGTIGLGAVPVSTAHAYIFDDSTGDGTNAYGLLVRMDTTANVTSTLAAIRTEVDVNSGDTIGNIWGLDIESPTGTGTVSSIGGGLLIEAQKVGPLASSNAFSIDQEGANDINRLSGQTLIAASGTPANSSVALEISSTTRALLVSRMTTTQRNALTAAQGMLIFNTSTSKLQVCTVGGGTPTWVDLH